MAHETKELLEDYLCFVNSDTAKRIDSPYDLCPNAVVVENSVTVPWQVGAPALRLVRDTVSDINQTRASRPVGFHMALTDQCDQMQNVDAYGNLVSGNHKETNLLLNKLVVESGDRDGYRGFFNICEASRPENPNGFPLRFANKDPMNPVQNIIKRHNYYGAVFGTVNYASAVLLGGWFREYVSHRFVPIKDMSGGPLTGKKQDIVWRQTHKGSVHVAGLRYAGKFQLVDRTIPGSYGVKKQIVGMCDVNGDGVNDIVWSQRGKNAKAHEVWFMTGGPSGPSQALKGVRVEAPEGHEKGMATVGVGRFGRPASCGVVRMSPNGALELWLTRYAKDADEVSFEVEKVLEKSGAEATAVGVTLVGLGDFNGDGSSDFLWQEGPSSGRYAKKSFGIWMVSGMKNGRIVVMKMTKEPLHNPKMDDVHYGELGGIGYFDGDKKSDLLWLYQDQKRPELGRMVFWFMDGLSVRNRNGKSEIKWAPDQSARVAAIGDFDGKGVDDARGTSDIFWQFFRQKVISVDNADWRYADPVPMLFGVIYLLNDQAAISNQLNLRGEVTFINGDDANPLILGDMGPGTYMYMAQTVSRALQPFALNRYFNGVDHWVTTSYVDVMDKGPYRAYEFETTLGLLYADKQPGMRALYGCVNRTLQFVDHFVSLDMDCEGAEVLASHDHPYGVMGYVFDPNTYAGDVENTKPIYRCVDGSNHFVSDREDCHKVPGAKKEMLLGIIRAELR